MAYNGWKIERDAVIAEGMEAGGHIGVNMTLVRQVVEAVNIQLLRLVVLRMDLVLRLVL